MTDEELVKHIFKSVPELTEEERLKQQQELKEAAISLSNDPEFQKDLIGAIEHGHYLEEKEKMTVSLPKRTVWRINKQL